MFLWVSFRETKAAVKLHTLLDPRGNIPIFIYISDGKTHDVQVVDELIPKAGAFYVMDRGYIEFYRLHDLHQCQAFFVTRAKRNMAFRRRYSQEINKSTGVRTDQTIILTGENSLRGYPDPLRRIRFFDEEKQRDFVFLTNNFTLPALKITELYKSRWQVELFFQVDRAAPSDQVVLRHKLERRQDAGLDRGVSVCAHCHYEEASQPRSKSVQYSTDFERNIVRESPAKSST